MSDELKPCPFCGTTEMLRRVGSQPGEGWAFVRCDYCDAEGPDPDNLPGHWNTRKSPDDDWTRWKMGESIDLLAKERGCTRERMRHRLKRLDEGRTVIALEIQVREMREALEKAERAIDCALPLTDSPTTEQALMLHSARERCRATLTASAR